MPTYGYRCETNGHEFEAFQPITDPPLTKCEVCGEPVRRIFYPVGIVFKGQGFYKTDSRGSASSATPASDKGSSTQGDSGSGDAGAATPSGDTAKTDSAASKPDSSSKGSDAGASGKAGSDKPGKTEKAAGA